MEWLCYPAKVGSLLIMVYFSVKFFELGFSLSNLFELANADELNRTPDGVFMFGIPAGPRVAGENQRPFFMMISRMN